MADSAHRDRIREAIRIAVGFHLLIFVACIFIFGGEEIAKIAAFTLIPFWSMVTLIVWKRGQCATRVDYALIAYGYPILFGGFFLWNGFLESR